MLILSQTGPGLIPSLRVTPVGGTVGTVLPCSGAAWRDGQAVAWVQQDLSRVREDKGCRKRVVAPCVLSSRSLLAHGAFT